MRKRRLKVKHRLLKIAPDLIALLLANIFIVWFWFDATKKYEFENQGFLWVLLIVPIIGIWLTYKKFKEHPTVKLSSYGFIPKPKFPFARIMYAVGTAIILVSIGLFIIAIARPQTSSSWKINLQKESI